MIQRFVIVFALMLGSCIQREVKYSGLNDLVVGVQQIILFQDGGFYLELSLGEEEGKYRIANDTVFFRYDRKPKGWLDRLLIKDDFFESTETDEMGHSKIRIRRSK